MTFNWKKYLLVFLITLGIFAVAFLFSEYLYGIRTAQVKTIESTINQSIMESEIQYMLLADASCENNDTANLFLLDQINQLATRLEYLEEQRSSNDPEVIALKKQYSLLEIKDYLLVREQARRCNEQANAILYFYTNSTDCVDCKKMGYILTDMREEYDTLHVYSFDYNLELSAIETLKSIYRLESDTFPIIVIDRKPYYGFRTREEIEGLLPNLGPAATSTDEDTD